MHNFVTFIFPSRTLLRVAIQFYATLTDVVFGFGLVGPPELKSVQFSSLCEALHQCLDVAGSPDYTDLALLEDALECLLNLSSRYMYVHCTCGMSVVFARFDTGFLCWGGGRHTISV